MLLVMPLLPPLQLVVAVKAVRMQLPLHCVNVMLQQQRLGPVRLRSHLMQPAALHGVRRRPKPCVMRTSRHIPLDCSWLTGRGGCMSTSHQVCLMMPWMGVMPQHTTTTPPPPHHHHRHCYHHKIHQQQQNQQQLLLPTTTTTSAATAAHYDAIPASGN